MADIASLGLQIDGSQAQTTAKQVGATLDQLGAKGEAAAAKVTSAGDKVTESLERQFKTLQEAQRYWESQARAMKGASDAQAILERQQTEAAVVQIRAIDNLNSTAKAAESATFPLGRLRQSFASLAATTTGTNPVIDRIVTTLASFGVGNGWVIGIVGGIALIGGAMKLLKGDADAIAESAKKATEELEKMLRARSLGSSGAIIEKLFGDPNDPKSAGLYQKIADDRAKLNDLILHQNDQNNFYNNSQNEGRIIQLKNQLAREEKERDDARAVLLDIAQKNTAGLKAEGERQLADLITHNNATASQHQQALQLYKTDIAALQALQKAHPEDIAGQAALSGQINTLKSALFPEKQATQAQSATNEITRITDEIKRMRAEADNFGKDASITNRVQTIVDQISLLEKQKGFANKTAELEALKVKAGEAGEALKTQVQSAFNTTVEASILKMQQENAAQVALDATRRQSADAVNAVMIANAGNLAVEQEQSRATQAHLTLLPTYIAQIRALAEAKEREKQAANQPDTFLSNAQDLTRQIQANIDLHTGDKAAEMQQLNAAYIDALDYQQGLIKGSTDWKVIEEAINVILAKRKSLIDATRTAEQQAAKAAEEQWNAVAAALHGVADLVGALSNSKLGAILNSGANIAQSISAYQAAASRLDAQGNANPDITGKITALFGGISSGVGLLVNGVSLLGSLFGGDSEWSKIIKQNTEAIKQNTLKNYIVNASNTSNAATAVNAIIASNKSIDAKTFKQIQGLGPFASGGLIDVITKAGEQQKSASAIKILSDAGLSLDQLNKIAQSTGVTLLDSFGNIIPKALQQFSQNVEAAARAAFTLTDSFNDQLSLQNLINQAANATKPADQLKAAVTAFGKSNTALGIPTDTTSSAGQAALRKWVQGILTQEANGTLDWKSLGGFQNIQDFNNALSAILGPLNDMTNSVTNATAALTNVPSGYKIALSRFHASLPTTPVIPGIDTVGLQVPTILPHGGQPNPSSIPPITLTGDVYITSSAPNAKELLQEVSLELQRQVNRGGANRLTLLTSNTTRTTS